jgi:hypothetical protein
MSDRLLKNGVSGRDPALRGVLEMLIRLRRTPLSKTPRALADGPRLVFRQPAKLIFVG